MQHNGIGVSGCKKIDDGNGIFVDYYPSFFNIITHPALWAPLLLEGNVCDALKVRKFRRVGMF